MLAIPVLISAQVVGECHRYPGAAAKDVLQLISDNLNDDRAVPVENGKAVLKHPGASIVTVAPAGQTSFLRDDMVRRALTAIGSCALKDYGTISGYFIAEDGSKTCYLYPGSEAKCG